MGSSSNSGGGGSRPNRTPVDKMDNARNDLNNAQGKDSYNDNDSDGDFPGGRNGGGGDPATSGTTPNYKDPTPTNPVQGR